MHMAQFAPGGCNSVKSVVIVIAVTHGTRTVDGLFATRRELHETIPITCNFRTVEFFFDEIR